MKRFMDVVASGLALIVLSPLMMVIAVMVAATSRGGVFFRGPRVGQYGRTFRIFKFRSMTVGSEGRGNWNVGMDDDRVTRIGRFLRATKLDELPQFLNVLAGDMSLVGPRPELRYYVDMYTETEASILKMKPGITDWASLVNYRQFQEFTEVADPDDYYLRKIRPLKLHLQLHQLNHQSLSNDVRVLLWTAGRIARFRHRLPSDIQLVVDSFREESFADVR